MTSRLPTTLNPTIRPPADGASPSGKATVFGTVIRRFESSRPSQAPSAVIERPVPILTLLQVNATK